LNGSIGYITIWYDQSNIGNNATQTNTSAQPIVNITNKLITFPDNCYFNLPDGTVPYNNSAFTITFKHGVINSLYGGFIGSGNYGNDNQTNAIRMHEGNSYDNYWFRSNNDFIFSFFICISFFGVISNISAHTCW
jgi:hypothetical protein